MRVPDGSFFLSSEQTQAISSIAAWFDSPYRSPVFRIDGYAGTGKTTIISHAIDALGIEKVLYAAFTGKAASVMTRKGLPATTLHRLLYRPVEVEEEDPETKEKTKVVRWKKNRRSNVGEASLVVLDEVSMVGRKLANDLLSFGTPVLVLGDPGQLPPINGDGAFTDGEPDVMLTTIHRQARESKIIEVATMAREGTHIPFGKYGDKVIKMRRRDLTTDMLMRADQVICGFNKTRSALNFRMRNAAGVHQPLPWGHPGEKIICLENNYEFGVLNGAFLRLSDVEDGDGESFSADVTSDDCEIGDVGTRCGLEKESFFAEQRSDGPNDLVKCCWGYAITCHKSQGSEWPNVIVIDDGWGRGRGDDRKRWIYTAITRASEKLVIAE